jgi:hypothetical protein
MRRNETVQFLNHAANVFEQARWHEKIRRGLFPKILLGQGPLRNGESEALIAAASVRYAGGDDKTLAAHAEKMTVPFDEGTLLIAAARRLRLNPRFRQQLCNGDATPLIQEALDHASARVYGSRRSTR